LHNRGKVYALLGEPDKAIADNLRALELAPDDVRTCNNLAWLWATTVRPELRNPTRALECALQACTGSAGQEPSHLDTLAAAYAAAGRFAEAVEAQRKAVDLVPEGERQGYRQRLALYEAGRPFVQD
jgi:tetratricopeptide (TPR) repeat protein